jgi:hypothetical protein
VDNPADSHVNKIQSLAPIALFVYNRPEHARRTIESLRANDLASDSDLIIFSDGPKNPDAKDKVGEVRELIRAVSGFRSVTIRESPENKGLAKSIIEGVTDVCTEYGRIIVLEDDLVTSPWFLRYMNEALREYELIERVVSVHGYTFPVDEQLPETFFVRGADCWGWATWRRGWDLFEPDGAKLLAELRLKKLTRLFDFDGAYSYTRMLKKQIAGKNQSWAVRWHAAAFLANRLTLYPGTSLVQNIGNDMSGTHCSASDTFFVKLAERPITVGRIPLEECFSARMALVRFWKASEGSLATRIARRIRRALVVRNE